MHYDSGIPTGDPVNYVIPRVLNHVCLGVDCVSDLDDSVCCGSEDTGTKHCWALGHLRTHTLSETLVARCQRTLSSKRRV